MAYANPHYDPEWKVVHDRHAAERARLAQETRRLVAAGVMTSEAYKQAMADSEQHN